MRCAFINAVSDGSLNLSEGSVYSFCKGFSERCKKSVEQIENELLNTSTVNTDATVITENGKQAYGECNVHLLRYLTKNTEETKTSWASDMAGLLCEMNDERKKRISAELVFTVGEISAYEERYDGIISAGRAQNKKTIGKLAKQEENTLLNRLEKYKENHLLFIHDFSVPFENNISERDLRKCKNRQKMAGGFRKHSGNEMYCAIMSVIETCKKKKMQVFENIQKILNGTPAIF